MLSAKIVAQKPCDNVIPTLPPGHADADIIMGGGGASAARAAAAERQASRKRDVLNIIATPAGKLHKRGKAGAACEAQDLGRGGVGYEGRPIGADGDVIAGCGLARERRTD